MSPLRSDAQLSTAPGAERPQVTEPAYIHQFEQAQTLGIVNQRFEGQHCTIVCNAIYAVQQNIG